MYVYANIFVANCPNLNLPNGTVSYKIGHSQGRYRREAIYKCNEGFYISTGSRVRACEQSGNWNGQPAVCQGDNLCICFKF